MQADKLKIQTEKLNKVCATMLYEYIIRRGISIGEFEKQAGLQKSYLSRIKSNERNITIRHILSALDVLYIDPEVFLCQLAERLKEEQ